MKRSLRFLSILVTIMLAGDTHAQIHPLAFGGTNWYANYNGTRFEVIAPGSIAGNKVYTSSNDGKGGTSAWGGYVTTPIINTPIIMPPGTDSTVTTTTLAPGTMAGKIAFVYRGGSEFGHKAHQAQNAGAIACVIVNNIPGNPVNMGIGSEGSLVTIPVFMVSQADGNAMDAQYRAGKSVTMTITPWGAGHNNDLGFVNQGMAGSHNYATPYNQLVNGPSPTAFNGIGGAFIANYGINNITGVKVTDTLNYTPKGFTTTRIHTGVTSTLSSFAPIDSIYAMLPAAEYSFAPYTGPGRFDLKYTITSDSTDDNPADNTASLSFYATDSVYSKGSYDFVNNKPNVTSYLAGPSGLDYMWGPTYYVRHGGTAISGVQFSLSSSTPGIIISLVAVNVYAMKWVDGSGGQPNDGLVENGELQPISLGVYNFSPSDTSGGTFQVSMGDPVTGAIGPDIFLDSNSWYYIAVEVPGGFFLGCDGQASTYPRIYGRSHVSGEVEYSNMFYPGLYNSGSNPMTSNPYSGETPTAFTSTLYVASIDSFNYAEQKGLIPAVAMIVNNTPSKIFGATAICVGSTSTLSDLSTGGSWTSSNTAIATVGPGSGIVSGVAAGTATITYSSTPVATKTVTIETSPIVSSITGTTSICTIGGVSALADATSGGVWTTSMPSVAYIDMTGSVTGMSTGTTTISYTVTNSCGSASATTTMSVGAPPSAGTISGASSVCIGATITLADAVPGGNWNSGTPGVASVTSTGVVSGATTGAAIISYTVTNACGFNTATSTINVITTPDAGTITGPDHVCTGATISLADIATGGAWTSSNANASVSTSGDVIGITAGADVITYTVSNSCGSSNTQLLVTISECVNKVNNVAGENDITVYPNPTNDQVTISAPVIISTVTITNILGEKVFSEKYAAKSATLNMKQLPAGVYTLKINNESVFKLVKR